MKIAPTFTSVAASVTGFASNVTGASWPLTATAVGDNLAHKVTIHNDSATDHSAKTVTIVGTDANDRPRSETLNLPAGTATVTSVGYFKTLVSPLTPSTTIGADTMDIGWAVDAVSPWVPVRHGAPIGVACSPASGTPTFSLQQSVDGLNATTHATIATKTTFTESSIAYPVDSIRVLITVAAGGVIMAAIAPD